MRLALLCAALACLAAPVLAQPAPPPPAASAEGTPVVIGRSYSLPSRVLGETRTLNVYLPPSYAQGARRYPVLFIVDGGVDHDFHHISGLSQLASVNGATEELIVVGIETRTRIRELTPATTDPRYPAQFPNRGGADPFRRYIAEEVIPFVTGRFRTTEDTALKGESLAGLFVVDAFLHQPKLFRRWIAVSPSLWWDARGVAHRAPDLLAAGDAQGDFRGRSFWLAIGDDGGGSQDGVNQLVAALRARPPAGLDFTYRPMPDQTHASIYHRAALEAVSQFWGVHDDTPRDMTAWWLWETDAAPAAPPAAPGPAAGR